MDRLIDQIIQASLEEIMSIMRRCDNSTTRFEGVYAHTISYLLKEIPDEEKCIDEAESLKKIGDSMCGTEEYVDAILTYNDAIRVCPQGTQDGAELFSILIGNRLDAFYALKEYENVINDLKIIEKYGHHPNLAHIYERSARAMHLLGYLTSATNYYNKALQHTLNQRSIELIQTHLIELSKEIAQRKLNGSGESVPSIRVPIKLMMKNTSYPALSSKVYVRTSASGDRTIIADRDIEVGEIVAMEKPHSFLPTGMYYRTNCAHCMKYTRQPIPCAHCITTIYCSLGCKRQNEKLHQIECRVMRYVDAYELREQVGLAVRMITQSTVQQLKDESLTVNMLKTHYRLRSEENVASYAVMGALVVRILKKCNFFGPKNDEATLTSDECFVGLLVIKYLYITLINAYPIHTLEQDMDISKLHLFPIGSALYLTLALFDHSCDPSITSFDIGKVKVFKSMKPIKSGDVIYANYDCHYLNRSRDERRVKLKADYFFACKCVPCIENWPMLRGLYQRTRRHLCVCGGVLLRNTNNVPPIESSLIKCFVCSSCKMRRGSDEIKEIESTMRQEAKRIEAHHENKENDLVIRGGTKLLTKYMKETYQPNTETITLQEVLSLTFALDGNKNF